MIAKKAAIADAAAIFALRGAASLVSSLATRPRIYAAARTASRSSSFDMSERPGTSSSFARS
jgi:hypothetical protein